MILAVDVDYRDNYASIGGVTFAHWEDNEEIDSFQSVLYDIEQYTPGKFYRRELPCILKLIEEHQLKPNFIIIDGFVYLDGVSEPGLGKHLYDALNGNVPIIGVAKKQFKKISSNFSIYRGSSQNPLYVTSVGIGFEVAKELIISMHGKYRIPTLLKKADQVCRKDKN